MTLDTIDELYQRLADSGLMSQEAVESFQSSLPPKLLPYTLQDITAELIRRGLITGYQIGALSAGRGHDLVYGQFIVLEKIAEGETGEVFRALDRTTNQVVALKTLTDVSATSPETVARFQREAQVILQLDHPNIVRALEVGCRGYSIYLVMELVEGHDLSRYVTNFNPLSPIEAIRVIFQVAEGLEYAHNLGIVHRDIQPANLFYNPETGVVKILDLGLANIRHALIEEESLNQESTASLTDSGELLGNVDFMAPEQAANPKHVDPRGDLYSLGCTWFYLLTGLLMYRGDDPLQVLEAHREHPIPRVKDFLPYAPRDVQPVFEQMVAKHPEDRYISAEALLADLAILVERMESGAEEAEQAARMADPGRGSSFVVAAPYSRSMDRFHDQKRKPPLWKRHRLVSSLIIFVILGAAIFGIGSNLFGLHWYQAFFQSLVLVGGLNLYLLIETLGAPKVSAAAIGVGVGGFWGYLGHDFNIPFLPLPAVSGGEILDAALGIPLGSLGFCVIGGSLICGSVSLVIGGFATNNK